jgi:hypothetical protein
MIRTAKRASIHSLPLSLSLFPSLLPLSLSLSLATHLIESEAATSLPSIPSPLSLLYRTRSATLSDDSSQRSTNFSFLHLLLSNLTSTRCRVAHISPLRDRSEDPLPTACNKKGSTPFSSLFFNICNLFLYFPISYFRSFVRLFSFLTSLFTEYRQKHGRPLLVCAVVRDKAQAKSVAKPPSPYLLCPL